MPTRELGVVNTENRPRREDTDSSECLSEHHTAEKHGRQHETPSLLHSTLQPAVLTASANDDCQHGIVPPKFHAND